MDRRIRFHAALTIGLLLALGAGAVHANESGKGSPAVMPLAAQPNAQPAAIMPVQPTRKPLINAIERQYSSECRVKSPAFEGRAPLRSVRRAILAKRPVRVVAIGSSSTVGVGASSPRASYPVRLENDLEGVIEGLRIEMFSRGQAGEVADAAAERLKAEVAEIRPDLVVWQVGTNDAVARLDVEGFGERLRETLSWLASHNIDVVLIDPQYIERLSNDARYTAIVNEISTVAGEKRVLLVNRYDAMADLSRAHPGGSYLAGDRFHLNDLGYRCMAEYAARAIVAGVLQAEAENGATH